MVDGLPGQLERSGQTGGDQVGGRQEVWTPIEVLTKKEVGRVGLLRGYGNSIVPPLAAEFIKSVMEVLDV